MITATVKDRSRLIRSIDVMDEKPVGARAPTLIIASPRNLVYRLTADKKDRRRATLEVLDEQSGETATIVLGGLTAPAKKLDLMLMRS